MTEPFLGELRNFGFNFAPRGWALCQGQLLPISQNQALFALLGTTFGGDGQVTFGLPDLRGRVPVGWGQGPGLEVYELGEQGGAESVTLTLTEMPQHNHPVAASATAASKNPAGGVPAPTAAGASYGTTADAAMSPGMVGAVGGSQPHENRAPFLGSNWCIALEGIFPSRP